MHKDGRAYWARTIKALNAHQQHSTFVHLETLLYKSQPYLHDALFTERGCGDVSSNPGQIYIYMMYYIHSIDQPGLSTPSRSAVQTGKSTIAPIQVKSSRNSQHKYNVRKNHRATSPTDCPCQ